jgi:hypothetical protein
MERYPLPAGGVVTRATWPVPARDGSTGLYDPGPESGEGAADPVLVRRGQQGDLQAFDELIRRHTVRAYYVALAALHDHHDAQGTVQDVFLAAWQGLAGFRSEGEFGTWVHPIITRLALNKATRRHTAQPGPGKPDHRNTCRPGRDNGTGRRRPVSARDGADAPGRAAIRDHPCFT